MYCLVCKRVSPFFICKKCKNILLKPNISKRIVDNELEVVSFYSYNNIKELLHTKHNFIGYFVYKELSKESFKLFGEEFVYDNKVYSFACDDNIKSGYSHTAILNKALKSPYITPLFSKLRATNIVNYSGKSLQYRQKNPRKFKYNYKSNIDAILVDDIITTGTTLKEAYNILKKNGVNVLFALTLADARI